MVKRIFVILVGILLVGSTVSFAGDEDACYDWEGYWKANTTFESLKNYLIQKVQGNDFLSSINTTVYLREFYGKVNPQRTGRCKGKRCPDEYSTRGGINFYMQYFVSFNTIFPQHGFFFSVRDDLKIVNKISPRINISGVVKEDLFFRVKQYRYDHHTQTESVFLDETIDAEKWAKIYGMIVNYVNQFREEQEAREREK